MLVVRRGQPHWSGSSASYIPCSHLGTVAEALCLPIIAQENTIGVLHLKFEKPAEFQHAFDTEALKETRQRLAASAASQIALSLASLQLREILRDQSIRDPLTRLYNRRFLEESLGRELQLAGQKGQSIPILFRDLDHFKKFNDTFGHAAGGMVLGALADLFRNFFRATDIRCRYGAEEFAIILPEPTSQDATIRADALRLEVKNLRRQCKKQSLGQVTVSVGIDAFPEHGSEPDELLKDRCLYGSNPRGRDVVTAALPQNA